MLEAGICSFDFTVKDLDVTLEVHNDRLTHLTAYNPENVQQKADSWSRSWPANSSNWKLPFGIGLIAADPALISTDDPHRERFSLTERFLPAVSLTSAVKDFQEATFKGESDKFRLNVLFSFFYFFWLTLLVTLQNPIFMI